MNRRTVFPLLALFGCTWAMAPTVDAQIPLPAAARSASFSPPLPGAATELPPAPDPQPRPALQDQASPSGQQPSQSAPPPPSLSDLGFSPQQTQADPKLQARLDRRTRMLRIHQRLGLITTLPMIATLITGPMAKAKGKDGQPIQEPTQANLDFHAALGGATAALYFTTASFAIFAPRIPGTKHRGPIRLHEALAFIHGPGMIATPILGALAYRQESAGERVHGAASAHGAVAVTTVLAYGAAMVAVSWPLKFRRHIGKIHGAGPGAAALPASPSSASQSPSSQ